LRLFIQEQTRLTLIWGRIKTRVINAIQETAPMATGKENFPKWKGPLTNCLEYRILRAIGMPFTSHQYVSTRVWGGIP